MDIFLITAPGLQDLLATEAREKGFKVTSVIAGGVTLRGEWPEVWRANLQLRGANRVLARITEFRALYLSQLELNAKEFDWAEILPHGSEIKVEATCHKSKIYHAGAAKERVETALSLSGYIIASGEIEVDYNIRVRIDRDIVTFSLDTSGEALHKRGYKEAVNKAPMRETMASLFLREAGFTGKEPLYDPMCGSGTFPIEAAEIALRLDCGRARPFTFQSLPHFDPDTYEAMRSPLRDAAFNVYGSDRDAGAIAMSQANAERAGVSDISEFSVKPISEITTPCEDKGLVIANPPYGGRIGNKKPLFGLYASFGERLLAEFKGWRVGIITTEPSLAKATKLPFKPVGPVVDHGGMKVRLYQTAPL
ncbi:putative N6-adenine-specific DNA methylase [Octadecabacter temperatus]|uniref:Ribosomal RNA large subunit methyltransferase L n=1 Tax=Octadecabacter temperatus TaxID=1458307 RepID=A0A0K0Y9I2_9RHOB|nr:RNA methyltransferase [Octadecabacter temperatus]AKS47532.1 Ribosomal RNA large subunit methyltransferase L [Octadecabacter temperatus]SIO41608.1 putative N6-adenine-specific DNA methylase [Octadecabacter temperatus]